MSGPSVLDAWLAAQCGRKEGTRPARDLAADVLAEQGLRLRRLLRYVLTRSPFYRERLRCFFKGGTVPDSFSPADLPLLPFTTAADLFDWKRFLCVPQDAVERLVTIATSGSTGPPKRLASSKNDLESSKEFFRVGMSQLVRAGERALVLWPGAARPFGVSALLCEALEEGGVKAFAGEPLADASTLGRELASYDPHVIIAAPRQLAPLLELFARGFPRQALSGLLSSAEPLPPHLAEAFKSRGLLVLDHYGLTETGYGGGVECPAKDGLHLRALDLLVEIVDARSGEVLPDGREGEVVITTLTREAMPLIRYKTGDCAALRPSPCRCGSPLRRLGQVRGRYVRRGDTLSLEQPDKGCFYAKSANLTL